MGDDAVAVGRSRSKRPSQAMTKRGAQAVGYGNEASPNLAGRGDHRRHAIGVRSDIARFGLRAELDPRMLAQRVGQARIEGEPADPQSRLLAVMLGKGHRHGWLVGKPELDTLEWRRTARYDSILETELA